MLGRCFGQKGDRGRATFQQEDVSGIGNGQEGTHLIVLDVGASDFLCTKSLTQRSFGKKSKGARRTGRCMKGGKVEQQEFKKQHFKISETMQRARGGAGEV